MFQAGIIEEMMDDAFEMMEDDDLEDAADEEIENILHDVTKGVLGKAPAAVTDTLPVPEPEPVAEEAGASGRAEIDDMKKRLEALRS